MTSRSNKTLREHRAGSIRIAYEAGETNLTRLSRRFHVSRHTVRRDLGTLGITPNPHRVPVTPPTDVVRAAEEAFRPYFGTIPDPRPADPAETMALVSLKDLRELRGRVEALEEKIPMLEARLPVFTWVNTPGAQYTVQYPQVVR